MIQAMALNQNANFHWLRTGDEAFAQMLAAIDAAQETVRLEMYIFTLSPLGLQFRQALIKARQRGAQVRVLVDALGSLNLRENFWEPLLAVGGEFKWFNPLNCDGGAIAIIERSLSVTARSPSSAGST